MENEEDCKVFVGNLSWGTTDLELKEAFSDLDCRECTVIMDRETGRSRGFGFVIFNDSESAKKAIEVMDGTNLGNRDINVKRAQKNNRNRGGGGGGGYQERRRFNDREGGFEDRGGERGYNQRRGGGRGYNERYNDRGGDYNERGQGGYGNQRGGDGGYRN